MLEDDKCDVFKKGIVMRYTPVVCKQGVFIERYMELSKSILSYFGKAPTTKESANKLPLLTL